MNYHESRVEPKNKMKITSWLISAALTFAKEEEQAFTVNVSKNKMIINFSKFWDSGPGPGHSGSKILSEISKRHTETS